nr:hypothetical protein [Candidatus Sigynarchaeum springense]
MKARSAGFSGGWTTILTASPRASLQMAWNRASLPTQSPWCTVAGRRARSKARTRASCDGVMPRLVPVKPMAGGAARSRVAWRVVAGHVSCRVESVRFLSGKGGKK